MVERSSTPEPQLDGDGMDAALSSEPTVEQIMRSPVIAIDAGATLREAQELLEQHHIHHLLVEYRGKLIGVVSDRDVLRHLSPFVGTLSEGEARRQHVAAARLPVRQLPPHHRGA